MDFDFLQDLDLSVCEPAAVYRNNRELNLAWDLVENTGANLFLTGRAGTGKTTFLRKLRESSRKRMVVLAPTGVAAVNASGTTLHSFFQLPFSPFIPGKGFLTEDKKYLNVSRQKKRIISTLSLLVIDEISMVRPDMLDAIDSILRRLRGSSLPFGGVQLLLIGDLRQLPPVVKDSEWNLVKDFYPTPYFFESHALKKSGFHTVEMSVVYRQNDQEFLDILTQIRDGNASQDTLQRLNSRFMPSFNPGDEEGYIRLTTHNRVAYDINHSRLAVIDSPEISFEAEVKGEFLESSFPAEKTLRLKKGAQVMFVKNDTGAIRRYYNGLLGIVDEISEEKIYVKPLSGGDLIDVDRVEWENTRYNIDEGTKAIVQETVGVFRQYPLQLAWAITIHKSQGLTFDKAIIDAAHSFAPGQTYVALSRCRSLEGLVLGSMLPPSAVITDRTVNDFIEAYGRNIPDENVVTRLKEKYLYTLLGELFDFRPIRNSYSDFCRYALEYLVPVFPEAENILNDVRHKIYESLCEVATKFLTSYTESRIGMELSHSGSHLQERINNGCSYFLDVIGEIKTDLLDLPREIDNNSYAERLNNTLTSLIDLLAVKTFMFEILRREPFTAESFLKAKAEAVLSLDQRNNAVKRHRKSSAKKKTEQKSKPKRQKGYSTFETLRMWTRGLDIPQIARERNLAITTIGGHISSLVCLGKLNLDQVMDNKVIASVNEVLASGENYSFKEVSEIVNSRIECQVPDYLISIIYDVRRRSLNSEKSE